MTIAINPSRTRQEPGLAKSGRRSREPNPIAKNQVKLEITAPAAHHQRRETPADPARLDPQQLQRRALVGLPSFQLAGLLVGNDLARAQQVQRAFGTRRSDIEQPPLLLQQLLLLEIHHRACGFMFISGRTFGFALDRMY